MSNHKTKNVATLRYYRLFEANLGNLGYSESFNF